MSEAFLFDDFFVTDDDPGVTYTVTVRGRRVPIVCARGISLADKEAILQASLQRHVDGRGNLVVDGMDTGKATIATLVRVIKGWPFTYRDGRPVPVTVDTVSRLLSGVTDQLQQMVQLGMAAQDAQADGPFASSSAPASAAGAPSDQPSQPAASASE